MKLYDLRREEKMREARHWYIRSFNPASLDEVSSLMKTEKSATYVRMVLSYWEMAASFVVHGAIDRAMFYDASGEMLAVFCKLEHMIDDLRRLWISSAPDECGGSCSGLAGFEGAHGCDARVLSRYGAELDQAGASLTGNRNREE